MEEKKYTWEITDISSNGKRFAVEMEIVNPLNVGECEDTATYDGPDFIYLAKKDVLKLYKEFEVYDSYELIGRQFDSAILVAELAIKDFLDKLEEV